MYFLSSIEVKKCAVDILEKNTALNLLLVRPNRD